LKTFKKYTIQVSECVCVCERERETDRDMEKEIDGNNGVGM
jgi:hypothetical protein